MSALKVTFGMAVFALTFASVQAQPGSTGPYNSIPDSLKTVVFFDGFDGNTTTWKRVNGDSTAVRTEGTFLLLSNATDDALAGAESPAVVLDPSRDWEIEFLATVEGAEGAPELRLGWGSHEARIEFDLKPRLCEFQVIRITAGILFIVEPMRDFNAIHREEFNRITIRRIKDSFYFFANKQLLLETRYDDLPFESLYAGFSGKGLARFDFVRVSYLYQK